MSMTSKSVRPTFLQIKKASQEQYKNEALKQPSVATFGFAGSSSTATTQSNSPSSSSPEPMLSLSLHALIGKKMLEIGNDERNNGSDTESDSEPQYSTKTLYLAVDTVLENYDDTNISTPINSPNGSTPTPPNSPDYVIGSTAAK